MKITMVCAAVALLCLVQLATCDVYLHSPRGSNNRLNEQSATRNNNNRLFDSQNNNRGGYNVGVTTADSNGGNEAQHSKMQLFAKSIMPVEWTNQHGSGKDNLNVHSNFVLQYMCSNSLRNGQNTNEGTHESDAYYAACQNRERNKGLFTADEDLTGDSATHTRQNPNGNRSGNECPEERDYFPYWEPNPWKDIAYLTSEEERCAWLDEVAPDENRYCGPSQYSRDNHLGNTYGGYPIMYNWTVPTPQEACGAASCQCVLRLRYNISTADSVWIEEDGELKLLDYWLLNATYNDEFSPLQNDPYVDIDVDQVFKLAINTAQTARTFQDRTHIFRIVERPAAANKGEIYNVIVRGKRGNIVQTYPAVEYDFVPNHLHIKDSDWVHFQWEGSNTHDNNPNGGDGQTGDDGEGTGGTDRHNIVQIMDMHENYPAAKNKVTMFTDNGDMSIPSRTRDQLILQFATAGKGADVDPLLNNASPYFNGGLLRFNPGTYHYMCTRNNNFSNRGQKATLVVEG
eukprot:CAMPEP_0177682262 /NCGR_PEP_ID=MMETSP0447-20121125/31167_1 /TAXON_ID=0 /ORGANISM="Stygamoeba regulata, Strain BSH-02190019" /LENGTH=513 /DNA_ID=CAMNT_0019191757 /DNA_START=90 /DNA_END=1631 /DNA_ORIENTATION=+